MQRDVGTLCRATIPLSMNRALSLFENLYLFTVSDGTSLYPVNAAMGALKHTVVTTTKVNTYMALGVQVKSKYPSTTG